MSDWRSKLDSLKAAAKSKSVAPPDFSSKEEVLEQYSPKRMDDGRVGLTVPEGFKEQFEQENSVLVIRGWLFILSCHKLPNALSYHLSASLHPKGRSSTEKDWRWLGTLVQHLGAPREASIMPQDDGDPTFDTKDELPAANRPMHWTWKEDLEES